MPRKIRAKAAAPVVPQAPVGIAAEAPVPVGTPAPPAPVEEQDARSSLAAATGTTNTALQGSFLRDLVAVLGLKPGTAVFEARGAAAFALMASFQPRDGWKGCWPSRSPP